MYTNFNGYCDGDGDNFAGDYDKLGHNDLETYGFTGTLKWQLGDNLLTVVMDRQGVERDYIEDSDASPHADFNFFLNTDAEQWSTEIRLDGQTDRLRWVAGYYYLDIDIADANGAEIPGLGTDSMGTAAILWESVFLKILDSTLSAPFSQPDCLVFPGRRWGFPTRLTLM